MAYKDAVPIGELLEARRKKLGLNGTQAAQRLGVSQPQMSRYLRGIESPGPDKIDALTTFLEEDERTIIEAIHAQRAGAGTLDRIRSLEDRLAVLEEWRATVQSETLAEVVDLHPVKKALKRAPAKKAAASGSTKATAGRRSQQIAPGARRPARETP